MQKSSYILIIVIIIISLALIGYFKAVPGADQEDAKPRIEVVPESYDFGEAEYGQVLKYTFKVKNIGQENLQILKTATSCGCTTAKIQKKQIMPGEQDDLYVEYDTGAMSGSHAKGSQERIIYIKSNDPINPQIEAVIKAYVK